MRATDRGVDGGVVVGLHADGDDPVDRRTRDELGRPPREVLRIEVQRLVARARCPWPGSYRELRRASSLRRSVLAQAQDLAVAMPQ